MADSFALYLLLVVALAIGFLLGRREFRRFRRPTGAPRTDYFTGVEQLVRGHRGADLDKLVEALVSRDDSFETRLALGALVRRRGEVDRAIRIHQGLLARPVLTPAQRAQTELELARDYMAAGLLGRAENLLLELTRHSETERQTAERALLEIYQREREWQQAVTVGREIARYDRSVKAKLAHFQCELAEAALAQGDLRLARQELAAGADFDPACARVNLTGARVELQGGRHREARRLLRRAVTQDPECVPLTLAGYREACQALDDEAGYVTFLEDCLVLAPFLPVVDALAAHLEHSQGHEQASAFVMEQLLRNPTLGGFVALLDHLDRDGQPLEQYQTALVRRFSRSLLDKQPAYRCRNCGFSSQALMWQCPSCHEWDSCKPIGGAGGRAA